MLTNTAPFIALGLLTAIQLAVLLKKSDNRIKLVAAYIVFYGFTLNVETILFIFLHAYDYYPKVYLSDQFMDSLFGNLFSQASVGASALMVAFFDLKFIWQLLFIAAYFGIEVLFLALGVYEHHWFQSWMTSVGLVPLFWIGKKLYRKFYGSYGVIFEVFCQLLSFLALFTVFFNWFAFVATGIFTYNKQLLPGRPGPSWGILGFNVSAMLLAVCYWAYRAKKWYWKTTAFLFGFAAHYVLWKFGLIILKPGWIIPYTAISLAAGYAIVAFMGKYIKRNQPGVKTIKA